MLITLRKPSRSSLTTAIPHFWPKSKAGSTENSMDGPRALYPQKVGYKRFWCVARFWITDSANHIDSYNRYLLNICYKFTFKDKLERNATPNVVHNLMIHKCLPAKLKFKWPKIEKDRIEKKRIYWWSFWKSFGWKKKVFELEFEKWFTLKLFLMLRQSICTCERLYNIYFQRQIHTK